jgi:hypothetical protein
MVRALAEFDVYVEEELQSPNPDEINWNTRNSTAMGVHEYLSGRMEGIEALWRSVLASSRSVELQALCEYCITRNF